MPHQPASSALARFRVIDLTQVRSGPTACRQLADWGADVVQVQMPEHMRGDDTLGGQEGSDYQYTHRNKRSITLNLKEPEGIELLKKLIDKADVVVENFRPDVKFRLGIDYESLKASNPGLVYASISGFGQTGPLATRPGFDQIAQGMGGLMSVTGLAEHGPMRVGIPIADLCAGIFAAQGILVALLEREKSGQGQWLHTSLLESMVYMMDFQTSRWLIDQEVATQAGNFHPTSIPTGVYKARDGYMNIAVFGSKIWERFCDILEAPQWVTDPRYHEADFIFMIMDAWGLPREKMHRFEEIIERYGSIGASPYRIDIVSFALETRHGLWMAQSSVKPKGVSKKKRTFGVPRFELFTDVQGRFVHLLPVKEPGETPPGVLH